MNESQINEPFVKSEDYVEDRKKQKKKKKKEKDREEEEEFLSTIDAVEPKIEVDSGGETEGKRERKKKNKKHRERTESECELIVKIELEEHKLEANDDVPEMEPEKKKNRKKSKFKDTAEYDSSRLEIEEKRGKKEKKQKNIKSEPDDEAVVTEATRNVDVVKQEKSHKKRRNTFVSETPSNDAVARNNDGQQRVCDVFPSHQLKFKKRGKDKTVPMTIPSSSEYPANQSLLVDSLSPSFMVPTSTPVPRTNNKPNSLGDLLISDMMAKLNKKSKKSKKSKWLFQQILYHPGANLLFESA